MARPKGYPSRRAGETDEEFAARVAEFKAAQAAATDTTTPESDDVTPEDVLQAEHDDIAELPDDVAEGESGENSAEVIEAEADAEAEAESLPVEDEATPDGSAHTPDATNGGDVEESEADGPTLTFPNATTAPAPLDAIEIELPDFTDREFAQMVRWLQYGESCLSVMSANTFDKVRYGLLPALKQVYAGEAVIIPNGLDKGE